MVITSVADVASGTALLMDTHVWVWIAAGDKSKLSTGAVEALEDAALARRLWASCFSIWEIALKTARGDVLIDGDLHTWVAEQHEAPGVQLLGLTPALAIGVTLLPPWVRRRDGRPHRDPNDRFLVTSARQENAVLVTCDEAIIEYAGEGHLTAYDARP